MIEHPDSKTCKKCGETKPVADFDIEISYQSGKITEYRKGYCKDCRRAYMRSWRTKNKDKVNASIRQRYRANAEAQRLYNRAKRLRPRDPSKESQRRKLKRDSNPESARLKDNAWKKIQREIARGNINPQPCARCGAFPDVHAHHEDYSKPLDVIWLCPPCHMQHHNRKDAYAV
jgi:ribosomal protein S27AE